MATTSLVGDSEIEKGLEGRGMMLGTRVESSVWWMCRVESQDAEMRSLCGEL